MSETTELTPAGAAVLAELRRRGVAETPIDYLDRRPIERLERLGYVTTQGASRYSRGRLRHELYVDLTPAGLAALELFEAGS